MKIISIVLLLIATSFLSSPAFSQGHDGLYGNEWIDYNTPGKQYYKIKIFQNGMYRVTAATLQQAGAVTASITPSTIQLFHQGKEVPIQVETTSGLLNYVQFYGKKNTGAFDKHLYNDPTHHFNERYSMFHDTAVYFLTWGTTPSTKHFTTVGANLSNLPAKEQYFMHTNSVVYNNTWNQGLTHQIASEHLTKSTYEYGEGYGSPLAATRSATVASEHPYSGGPNATASVQVFTPGLFSHILNIKSGNTTYGTYNFNQMNVGKYTASFPNSIIQAGGTNVTITGTAANSSDQYYVSYIDLTYARTFNFDGNYLFPFKIAASNTRKYLEINNINTTNSSQNKFYLYDLTNNIRVQCFYDGANARLLTDLGTSVLERELIFINEGNPNSYQNIVGVTPVTFRNFNTSIYSSTNYVIITHPSLKTNSLGSNPIFDYRLYRQSAAGGSFVTIDVDIQELYDQFAYGIVNHPLAVRHFGHYIKQVWVNPEYVFIIGKGREYKDIRGLPSNQLIPTFGYPASDNVLMASINSDEPAIAVGRLSATTGDQVSLYLQKIKDVEAQRAAAQTLADRGWTKNILHLGGGRNSNEQNIIRNHLNAMKSTIEDTLYGGYVESFFKTSTNPIQVAQSSYLDSLINNGVSMLTFFGHSSANSFDFNLDNPDQYSNYQKYPLILALGCYGGTMFDPIPFISEDFIFEPQAGAGVFLASNGASALSALNYFAQEFYRGVSYVQYSQGAAKSVKHAISVLENSNGGLGYTTTNQMVCHYMVYHGDPAYKVADSKCPDYYIDETLVSHSPSVVTVQMSTFNLELDVYNLGRAIDTAFNIRVERIYPDGSSAFVTTQRVTAPLFHDHIPILVPVGTANALGLNKFNIYIDSDDEIDECPAPSAEQNNNVIQYNVAIVSDDILPVYPYEFAIVPATPITLKASTGNAFAVIQTYKIQIDTTEYFNSPLMEETVISQVGGLVEWIPPYGSYLDSTVYYWRVSIDSTSPSSSYSWATSSFIYIYNEYPGWNQSHFFQFLKDEHTNILIQEPSRKFEYINSIQTVSATTAKTPANLHPENVAIYFNGSKLDKCRCSGKNGIYAAVIEPGTLNFWELDGPQGNMKYGAINCDGAGRTTPTFLFETNLPGSPSLHVGQYALERFIRDSVPNGHYVLLYTLNNAYAFTWQASLINELQSHGALYVNDLVTGSNALGGIPWATFFKKGDLAYPHNTSVIGVDMNDVITIEGLLDEEWDRGFQTSTVIGPASNWHRMEWDYNLAANDQLNVEIYGIDINQNTRTRLVNPTVNLSENLTNIDPVQYPYLELVWNTADIVDKTSPQLEYWRILGDMVPEAALRPEMFLTFDSSHVQQGQPLHLEVAMENISDVDMDSMLVKFEIVGTNLIVFKRLDSLRVGDTLHAQVTFPTVSLQGTNYQLLVEINPNGDQPEKYHFNNIGMLNFEIRRDIVNPILDVTFDGNHIMNKDIVSGTPEIVISLSDENQYLSLDNLQDFSVIVRHPSYAGGETELTPANTDMQFYPADPTKLSLENKAKIILHPDFANDGTYTLFVSATDKTGNNSGQLSYSVDFEVINKSSISNMLNYPNPFSTSTQFVFTLTGRELPNYMKIQILTVTGKVVREITQEELGTLRIGINRTEYAWDGKDEYGDQLANGVYLYRVITKIDGKDLENYSIRPDYMFNQGFGKMYLMR